MDGAENVWWILFCGALKNLQSSSHPPIIWPPHHTKPNHFRLAQLFISYIYINNWTLVVQNIPEHISQKQQNKYSHTRREEEGKRKMRFATSPCIHTYSNCTSTHIHSIYYIYICNISFLCEISSVPHFCFCSHSPSLSLYTWMCYFSVWCLFPNVFFFRLLFWNSNLFHQVIRAYARIFVFVRPKTRTWFPHTFASSPPPPPVHIASAFLFVFSFPIFTFNHNEWVLCLLHTFIFVNINKKNGKKSIRDSKSMALLHTMCLNVNQQKRRRRSGKKENRKTGKTRKKEWRWGKEKNKTKTSKDKKKNCHTRTSFKYSIHVRMAACVCAFLFTLTLAFIQCIHPSRIVRPNCAHSILVSSHWPHTYIFTNHVCIV